MVLGSVLIILLTLPLFLIHEPFAKPSKISDFIPLNGFFLNSVLGMGTCPVYAGIDNTQQQEVNPCPL